MKVLGNLLGGAVWIAGLSAVFGIGHALGLIGLALLGLLALRVILNLAFG